MQRVSEDYDIISSNGLAIGVNITFRYRVSRKRIGLLHKYLGPNYLNTVLIPKIGAIARAEAAKYSPVQLYSTNRGDVEEGILTAVKRQMIQVTKDVISTEAKERAARRLPPLPDEPDPIVRLHDISFRSVTLPHLVKKAIERKEEQFHINLEYNFRLDRERKESERKAIEARGIQSFQRIVSDGITDAYLRWKGIDATLQLAQSNNSKIVLIGSGKDGLPIILGPLDSGVGDVAHSGQRAPAKGGFEALPEQQAGPVPRNRASILTQEVTYLQPPSKRRRRPALTLSTDRIRAVLQSLLRQGRIQSGKPPRETRPTIKSRVSALKDSTCGLSRSSEKYQSLVFKNIIISTTVIISQ